ncbi:MAG: HEAT repeat domain-containing protein [Candidatus Sumerlaeia bacterium]|nr:HEAT repeat domain-containing protein [Candidatus Sumerlaeia bacterium]
MWHNEGKAMAAAVLLGLCAFLGACKSSPPSETEQASATARAKELQRLAQADAREVEPIMTDLQASLIMADMTETHRKAFEAFCNFLAVRYRFDRAVADGKVTEEEAVAATQPLIDAMAALGAPMEDVLIRILGARKTMTIEQRAQTSCKEDPETFGAITLWTLRSKRAVPLLIELARSKNYENRRVFVRALGRIGDPRALTALRELADTDLDDDLRSEARAAITAIEAARARTAETTAPAVAGDNK